MKSLVNIALVLGQWCGSFSRHDNNYLVTEDDLVRVSNNIVKLSFCTRDQAAEVLCMINRRREIIKALKGRIV